MMPIELTNTSSTTVAIPFLNAVAESGENRLLVVARDGNLDAFERLVMPHQGRIFRLAQRILRNREDAEDVVQTALLKAFCHLEGFHGHARFSTWLFRIATNEALMRLRVNRRNCETSLDEVVDGDHAAVGFQPVERGMNPEEKSSARELRAIVSKAVNQLHPIYRDVLDLRHVQELSAKETAQALGISISTVKSRLHRARLKLIRSTRSMRATGAKQLGVKNRNGARAAAVLRTST